jgi:hypothetical protein
MGKSYYEPIVEETREPAGTPGLDQPISQLEGDRL